MVNHGLGRSWWRPWKLGIRIVTTFVLCKWVFWWACGLIGHFQVPKNLTFKTRLSAKPLIWKWFSIIMQIKLIFTTKVSHLASFWKWDFWNSEMAYFGDDWNKAQCLSRSSLAKFFLPYKKSRFIFFRPNRLRFILIWHSKVIKSQVQNRHKKVKTVNTCSL